MPDKQRDGAKLSNGDTLGIIYLIASSHATGITPFIRSGHGSESFGIKAIFALAGMVMLSGGRSWSGMGIYTVAWLAFLMYRRVETFNNWRKGMIVHSRFIGWPWLAMKVVKDPQRARLFEPVLCLLIGAVVWCISETVGVFIMWGFVFLAVCTAVEQLLVYKQVQRMNDAALDGQYLGERFRQWR